VDFFNDGERMQGQGFFTDGLLDERDEQPRAGVHLIEKTVGTRRGTKASVYNSDPPRKSLSRSTGSRTYVNAPLSTI